jgi:hypothetical protein
MRQRPRLQRLDRRQIGWWFAGAVVGFCLLALPWRSVATGFAAGYAAAADAVLFDHLTFGRGGHARLRPLRAGEADAAANVTPDAVIVLRVDGYSGEVPWTMSLRRDAYLPIAVLFAVVAAAPVPWRRRLRALAIGLPAIVVLTLGCQWFGILWLFGFNLRAVVDWSARQTELTDGLYQILLLPPANRFVVPLLMGIGCHRLVA